MRYTLMGNSGLRVSELALGTMTFGTDWGWGASKTDQLSDNLRAVELTLPPKALRALDDISRVQLGFPHDFLAAVDYVHGGMIDRLDLSPGRLRIG